MENKELEQYYEDLRSQINEGTPSEKGVDTRTTKRSKINLGKIY